MQVYTEKRKDITSRLIFNTVLRNLKDVLSCYDKQVHYEIIGIYLKTYKEYNILTVQAKARLYFLLGTL